MAADPESDPVRRDTPSDVSPEPPHIEGRASSDPTPNWEVVLESLVWDKLNGSFHFKSHYDNHRSETVLVVIAFQLAELLTFLRNLKIPAWLLKTPK